MRVPYAHRVNLTTKVIMKTQQRAFIRAIAGALLATAFLGLLPYSASAQTVEELEQEVEKLKKQMELLQQKIEAVSTAQSATGTALSKADEQRLSDQAAEKAVEKIQPALQTAQSSASQFNPAIGVAIDGTLSAKEHDRNDFEFRSAEIALSSNIDPFAKGYAVFNGTDDGVEVEEAAISTTSLPYNLSIKGGRFFADFGRFSKFHDHDLPFVNRPIVLDEYVGGESQSDGVELSYLVPTEQFINLTLGAYNKIGGENERLSNDESRSFDKFTYLGRASTYANINDENSVELGGSLAVTPNVEIENTDSRLLSGLDITYRYAPLSSASYRGLVWGTEVLHNHEHRPIGGFNEDGESAETASEFEKQDALGLYSYVEARLTRQWYPGFLFDYAEDVDGLESATRGYSPYLTFWASEFQRLRLQYTYLDEPETHDNQVFLQWTGILGSHVHGFRDR